LRAKERLAEAVHSTPVSVARRDEHGGRCIDRHGRTLARLTIAGVDERSARVACWWG